jgi:hypothetical protein
MSYATIIKPFAFAAVALVLVALSFALLGQISDPPPVDTNQIVVSAAADARGLETQFVQAASSGAPDRSQNEDTDQPDEAADREETTISTVTSELLETLRQWVRVNEQMYEVGAVQIETVIRSHQKLFEAQLDVAGSRSERIRILEARMQSFRELEKAVEQQHGAGRSSTSQLLATKAERLAAELALLREQAVSRVNSERSDRD